MTVLAKAAVALVALLHLYFLVLEMFLWTKPAGRRAFGTTTVNRKILWVQALPAAVAAALTVAARP